MNKLLYSFLSFLLITSMVVTTSCGTDDDPVAPAAPTFVVSGTAAGEEEATTVEPNQPVSFTLTINAPGGFNTLYIDKTGGTPMDRTVISRGTAIEETFVHQFTYTPTMEEAGETITFDFQAVDEGGLDNVFTYTITVIEPELLVWEQELLFAPLADNTSETWFSTSTGETYTSNEVNAAQATISNTIDFGYFYGATNEATLASVADYPIAAGQGTWTVKHATMLRKTTMTASAFMETTSAAAVQQAFTDATAGTNEGQATNLQEGDVVAFMTDPDGPGGSRYGLAHVSTITTGTGSTGSILINVKVMPVM